MKPDPVTLLLGRVFLCTSLAGTLAWIVYYFHHRGWSSPVGRNLLATKLVIAGLLLINLLGSFFRFHHPVIRVLTWVDLALLALIGPFMLWRMWVFHHAVADGPRCPSGHWLPGGARYCPECGVLIPRPYLPGAATPPEGIPAAD